MGCGEPETFQSVHWLRTSDHLSLGGEVGPKGGAKWPFESHPNGLATIGQISLRALR